MDCFVENKNANDCTSWQYEDSTHDPATVAYKESLFATGNGYIGVRGYSDEGYSGQPDNAVTATYLNGVYESLPIEYDESAYAFARNCHRIWVAPSHRFLVEVDGVRFSPETGGLTSYRRWLDYRTGTFCRELIWESPNGKHIRLLFRRAALHSDKRLVITQLELEALNFSGEVSVISLLQASDGEASLEDPRAGGEIPADNCIELNAFIEGGFARFLHQAKNSGIKVATSMSSNLPGGSKVTAFRDADSLVVEHRFDLQQHKPRTAESFISYVDSRNWNSVEGLLEEGRKSSEQHAATGFVSLLKGQTEFMDRFWARADIKVESQDSIHKELRFSLFHLLQSTGTDGVSSIAAKGVTGGGYDGHYFWDSEIYIFPFWLFSDPDVAKSLLLYRVSTLPAARQRAREMGHEKGALYAWRTIGGEECSSYFPAGTAQYHINADIAHAVRSYIKVTQDFAALGEGLAEMVIESARIWLGLGHFSRRHGGKFCICEVTGPDEYSAMTDNNYYTNKMAQQHLYWALEVWGEIQNRFPQMAAALMEAMQLSADELQQMEKAADAMFLALDEELGIIAQDEHFLAKPMWDFANTPKANYPLLLNYHPLVIYRHQVLKQADAVLALVLNGNDVPLELKQRTYDYYEPITTHDSTLSACSYGILASEIGYHATAYDYCLKNLSIDLLNQHNNTHYGVHTASMGGSWMSLVMGFAGLRYADGVLKFKPQLPATWQSMTFSLRYQGGCLHVSIESGRTHYRYDGDRPITIEHFGSNVELSDGGTVEV